MSTENVSIEQHLAFVNKMCERVKGTDLEPIWERLRAYIEKINDLNDEKRIALDATIKKVIGKIEHFKNISIQRLEAINVENKSDHELDAHFETSQATELPSPPTHGSNSQSEQPKIPDHEFIKPKVKAKKFKRFRMGRQVHPLIVMSPRGDNIPVMRIKLADIYNKKRQKKNKDKKTKDVDVLKAAIEQYEKSKELQTDEQIDQLEKNVANLQEIQQATENVDAVENAIQNPEENNIPMEVERINEISTVHDTMNEKMELKPMDTNLSDLGLKNCYVRIEKCTPEKAKNDPQSSKSEPSKPSTQSESPSTNGTKTLESLAKIPIEKSKSVAQNGSNKVNDQECIFIVDSDDDDDNMQGHVSIAPQIDSNAQKVTPNVIPRLRRKSQYQDSSIRAKTPTNSNSISSINTESSRIPPKSLKTPDKGMKNTKYVPKKAKLDDDMCIVSVKTVDLSARPQISTKNQSELKSPSTPQTLSKCPEQLKSVTKSAPVAITQGPKRNRNSIDTLPDPKRTVQNSTVRQSVRQAIRRNSIATRTIDFKQPSPSKPKQPEAKQNFIKIISVESIPQSSNILKKILTAKPELPVKKLPNARKSTKSNKVMLSRDMHTCNQTQKNNNVNQVTVDYSEPSTSKVNNLSNPSQVPKNDSSAIKNEPKSPNGYMTPPMTEIPTSIMIVEAQKDKKLVLLNAAATLNKIRPWLKASEHRKFLKNCENMLGNGFCLSALFKCMGSTCSYYTSNPTFFLRHLKIHQQKQANDMKYFSQCAYCSIIDDNPEALVQHIADTHGYSSYQCAYCFYRSCDFHIHTHHKLFHPLKSEVIIECKPLRRLDIEKEFSNALSNVMNVCKPVFCCVCKFKFYNIKNFENHYKAYPSVPSSRCLHCKFEINQETIMDHLKECHKFGDFNCAFCSFASDSSDSIKIHLSNLHYDKPMLYYDRTKQSQNIDLNAQGSKKKEDVLKSVVLKKLIHQEQTNAKNIKIFNDQHELDNAHNINTGLLEQNK